MELVDKSSRSEPKVVLGLRLRSVQRPHLHGEVVLLQYGWRLLVTNGQFCLGEDLLEGRYLSDALYFLPNCAVALAGNVVEYDDEGSPPTLSRGQLGFLGQVLLGIH